VNLTILKLHQQLNLFRVRGVPDIRPNSNYCNKTAKQQGLEDGLQPTTVPKARLKNFRFGHFLIPAKELLISHSILHRFA
jgi:hypothetical protein